MSPNQQHLNTEGTQKRPVTKEINTSKTPQLLLTLHQLISLQ